MKVILAVADYKGKNVVFVANTLKILSLGEFYTLAKKWLE